MKKLISMILAVMLIVGAASTSVFADNNNENGEKVKICLNLFEDSDEVSWAQKAIDKLKLKDLIKGNNGKFQPKRSVTQLEAIIMCLRIMDWEDEALLLKNLPKKYKGAEVQKWAVGYINKATDLGILDEVDLMYFKPSAPVKRHEMAKYIIRALQKDSEAKAKMNAELPFVDAAAVPQGSVGYVFLVNELKIMQGDGKGFNPMGTLKRAEMAVLFNNLDNKVDNDNDVDEFKGIVESITTDKLVLKIGALKRTFDVSEDAVVYKDTTRVAYSTIVNGAKVLLKTDDGIVEYIEILKINDPEDKIITNYTGLLTAVIDGVPVNLTVKIEEMIAIFKVADNAEFYFKGIKGTVNDLKVGDTVSIAVDDNNRALKIVVDRQLTIITEDTGKMTAIDLVGTYHISIDDIRYNLSNNAAVKIDSIAAEFDDLLIGMDMKINLENNIVVLIEAET